MDEVRVPVAAHFVLAMPGKLLKRELTQALQHPEPLLSRDRSCWFDQAGVRQGCELTEQHHFFGPVAYHRRCRKGPAPAEDRQRPERPSSPAATGVVQGQHPMLG